MKTKLLRLLAWSFALVLMMGLAVTASADDPTARVIVIEWIDENNLEGFRPDSVDCQLGSELLTVSKSEGWTGITVGTSNGWSVTKPDGYDIESISPSDDDVTVVTLKHTVDWQKVTVAAEWVGDGDQILDDVRPSKVKVQLLANGKEYGAPITLSGGSWSNQWDNLPKYRNKTEELNYSVQVVETPEYYNVSYEKVSTGYRVIYTLKTGTLRVNTALTNPPVLTPGLNLRIEGPDKRTADPSNPYIVPYNPNVTLPNALMGAYLVTIINPDAYEDEGFYVVPADTTRQDAVYINDGETVAMNLRVAWTNTIPDKERNENPLAPEAINQLLFKIIGPDETMPMTITYQQFATILSSPEQASAYLNLGNLKPGSYAVVEQNAGTLIDFYRLLPTSVTGVTFRVRADETAARTLRNDYIPALTPPPQPDLVNIPVTKIWDDNDNAEGSRPESITVRLYADGAEVESRQLTAANNWSITFMDLPRYRIKDVEYVYSVQEDPVPLYLTSINGTTITNTYQSVLTRTSVRKLWNDNNNAAGLRPASVTMTLRNGASVVTTVRLSDENGWYAEVTDLPSRVNGAPAVYTWTEQEVIGYVSSMSTDGTSVVFTNTPWERPPEPRRTPRVPGRPVFVFEEYETPLGIAVEINHVGDCFD